MKPNRVAQFGRITIAILLPVMTLVGSAMAQVRPTTLSDSEEPGSVIVFPKFVRGLVTPTGTSATAKTEIAVTVVCPAGVVCPEGQRVKIRFHWVCGGNTNSLSGLVCRDTDFDVLTTVNGTAVFTPEPSGVQGTNTTVPAPPCNKGYLIGWVIRPTDDNPIKFDGLIGNAVLRESASAVSSYNGIPIQADPALANGALITTDANNSLIFDGDPGHYQAITGVVIASVAFDKPATNLPAVPNRTSSQSTLLTLLTLDTRANRPNYPTFVDLDFFNSQEALLSTATDFVCWESVKLSSIDGSLTTAIMSSRKGNLVSGPATKIAFGGIADTAGPVTLLGLVETLEGPSGVDRSYSNGVWNDSVPVPTAFVP